MLDQHARFPCPRRVFEVTDFMTREKFDAIRKRADRKTTFEEQWRHIFGILFPDVSWCPSPYMGNLTAQRLEHLQRVFSNEGMDLLRRLSATMGLGYTGQHDELLALFQPVYESWVVRVIGRLAHLEGEDPAFENHDGNVSWNSVSPNPAADTGSVYPDIGFPELSPGYLKMNGASVTPVPLFDPSYSAQAAPPCWGSSLAQSYTDGSLCLTVNPRDLVVRPMQPINVGHHDWDLSVDLRGLQASDPCLSGPPTGSSPLGQLGNLDDNTGEVPHPSTLGDLLDMDGEGFDPNDIAEPNRFSLEPGATSEETFGLGCAIGTDY